jgi:hypothetical protein
MMKFMIRLAPPGGGAGEFRRGAPLTVVSSTNWSNNSIGGARSGPATPQALASEEETTHPADPA